MVLFVQIFGQDIGDEVFKFVAEITVTGGFLAEDFDNVVNGLFHPGIGNYRQLPKLYANGKRKPILNVAAK